VGKIARHCDRDLRGVAQFCPRVDMARAWATRRSAVLYFGAAT
jgi:hypothetical protein